MDLYGQAIRWLRAAGEHKAADLLVRCSVDLAWADECVAAATSQPETVAAVNVLTPQAIQERLADDFATEKVQIEKALRQCQAPKLYVRAVQWLPKPGERPDAPGADGDAETDKAQEPCSEKPLTLFPDTNILLHYPQLNQIDWRELAKRAQVKLVICLEVIKELDKYKTHPHLGKRANGAVKLISHHNRSKQPVREEVTLSVFNCEIDPDDFPPGLRPAAGDDRIVHLFKKYGAKHPDEEGGIVTGDFNMELRCEAHGVWCFQLDPALRLPDPKDEVTRRNRELQVRIDSLEKRLPELSVLVSNEGQDASASSEFEAELSDLVDDTDINTKVQEERTRLRKKADSSGCAPGISRHIIGSVPASEQARFARELDEYIPQYRFYLQELAEGREASARTMRFRLWLSNSGSCPAEDIDVNFVFPDRFEIIADCESEDAEESANVPTAPVPPELPKKFGGLLDSGQVRSLGVSPVLAKMPSLVPHIGEQWLTTDVSKLEDGRYEFRAKLKQLKHHFQQPLGRLLACFRTWDEVGTFQVEYTIAVANHPELTKGKVVFKVRRNQS